MAGGRLSQEDILIPLSFRERLPFPSEEIERSTKIFNNKGEFYGKESQRSTYQRAA